jgi:hypothetical protein
MNTAPMISTADTESPGRSKFRDPLFLLGPARSYSTVSVALLAGHPDLYGLPETSLFLQGTVGEIMAMPAGAFADQDAHRHRLMGLERAIAQLHDGSQDQAALNRALGWIRERPGMSARDMMDYLLTMVYPSIAVEKSPATVESAQALARCLRAYPNARYLHLTRHPVSTQRSMLKLYNQYLFPGQMPQAERVRRCVQAWYSCHLRIVQALRALPQPQWLRIRAEDLVGEPRTWLPRVLDWLGLTCDDAIIAGMLETQRWEFAGWDGHIGFGGADPQFLAAPELRPVPSPGPDVIDPTWELADDIRVKIITLARYLGY